MRHSRNLAVFLVWMGALACVEERTTSDDTMQDVAGHVGGDVHDEDMDGGDIPAYSFCEGPIVAVFDPDDGLVVPFPSDLFSAEDPATLTGRRVHLAEENSFADSMFQDYPSLRAQLNELDGFGTTAGLVFALSDEIGAREIQGAEAATAPPPSLSGGPASTITTDSAIVLLGIEEGSPDYARPIPLLVEYVSDASAEGVGQHLIIAEPAVPLRPKTTYAAALTRRLTDLQGACVAPSEATRRLVSGLDAERFGRLGALAPEALHLLREGGFIRDPGDVTALTVFTTQSIEEEIVQAVETLLEQATSEPPRVVEGSLVFTPGTDGVAVEVRGTFPATRYLNDHGVFVIEDGQPVAQGVDELEFLLTIPETTSEHQPPFPLVIHNHGLVGDKDEDMGMKYAQARAGFATIAIDAVMHGSRMLSTGMDITNFFGIDMDAGSFDMPAARDNFRQTYLDNVALGELASDLSGTDFLPLGAPDGLPEIEASPLYLTGHSLGASIGAAVTALSPRVAIVNLCAGGGGVLNILLRGEVFNLFVIALAPEGTTDADLRRFFPLLQTLMERGDPANYARLVTSEPLTGSGCTFKHVLFQEVEADTFVPNITNELLSRGLGLAHVRPVEHEVYGLPSMDEPMAMNHENDVTAGFFQFAWQNEGTEPAIHTHIFADEVAQAQWIHFFSTFRASGRPEVINPYRAFE